MARRHGYVSSQFPGTTSDKSRVNSKLGSTPERLFGVVSVSIDTRSTSSLQDLVL